jgi:hypothetical protein
MILQTLLLFAIHIQPATSALPNRQPQLAAGHGQVLCLRYATRHLLRVFARSRPDFFAAREGRRKAPSTSTKFRASAKSFDVNSRCSRAYACFVGQVVRVFSGEAPSASAIVPVYMSHLSLFLLGSRALKAYRM